MFHFSSSKEGTVMDLVEGRDDIPKRASWTDDFLGGDAEAALMLGEAFSF